MRVVPVLDLLGGEVVRGVAGNRAAYRPIKSILCDESSPVCVGKALVEKLGFAEAYVADLDAIAGGEPAWDVYRRWGECGLSLWVDAGLHDAEAARRMVAFGEGGPISRIIAGLETIDSPDRLAEILAVVGPERLVFSLDLKEGRPLTDAPAWRDLKAIEILDKVIEFGLRQFIVLDLARVGVNSGVGTEDLCRQLREMLPEAHITAGGGVRDIDDLRSLAAAGCDAVLVASALHDGRIGADTMKSLQ